MALSQLGGQLLCVTIVIDLAICVVSALPNLPNSREIAAAAWLQAHGLTCGIAGRWDASTVTLEPASQVQARAVTRKTAY